MGLRKGERKWWDSGSPRKQERNEIMMRMHEDGMTMAAIARLVGVSRARVHQIVTRDAPSTG